MARDILGLNCQETQLARARRHTVRRPTSWAERVIPLNFNAWREQRQAFEVIVTGHNPFLAAILLKKALSYGMKCLVTVEGYADTWPYDLANHHHAVHLTASALGIPSDRYGPPERFFAGFVEEFVASEAGMITVLKPGLTLRALERQHEREVSLAVGPGPAARSSVARDSLSSNLALAISASPRLDVPARGDLFVFTPRAILTGISDGFAPGNSDGSTIRYDNSHIFPVGTAARVPASDVGRAQMMVDDIVRCSRFEF